PVRTARPEELGQRAVEAVRDVAAAASELHRLLPPLQLTDGGDGGRGPPPPSLGALSPGGGPRGPREARRAHPPSRPPPPGGEAGEERGRGDAGEERVLERRGDHRVADAEEDVHRPRLLDVTVVLVEPDDLVEAGLLRPLAGRQARDVVGAGLGGADAPAGSA